MLQYFWGTYGLNWQGGLAHPYQTVVEEGNTLYVASYDGGWANDLVPKSGTDSGKLVGRPLILETNWWELRAGGFLRQKLPGLSKEPREFLSRRT